MQHVVLTFLWKHRQNHTGCFPMFSLCAPYSVHLFVVGSVWLVSPAGLSTHEHHSFSNFRFLGSHGQNICRKKRKNGGGAKRLLLNIGCHLQGHENFVSDAGAYLLGNMRRTETKNIGHGQRRTVLKDKIRQVTVMQGIAARVLFGIARFLEFIQRCNSTSFNILAHESASCLHLQNKIQWEKHEKQNQNQNKKQNKCVCRFLIWNNRTCRHLPLTGGTKAFWASAENRATVKEASSAHLLIMDTWWLTWQSNDTCDETWFERVLWEELATVHLGHGWAAQGKVRIMQDPGTQHT